MENRHESQKNRVTRRDVLGTGMSGVALALCPGQITSGDNTVNADLIDAHVHVWTPDIKKYPLAAGYQKADMQPSSFTPAQLMAHAKPCGVSRIVLIQMSFYGFDNSYMLHTMRKFKGTYSGVAVINEKDDPTTEMKRLARHGVRGFRIRPRNQSPEKWLAGDGMQAMWKCGADQGLAMCHLINPEYLPSVDQMCQKYPRTPVVIDHFARIGIDGSIRSEHVDDLCRLARFPHVAVKVSAYYALGKKKAPYHELGPMIRSLRDAFGAERLMWASDCPFQVQGEHTYAASIDLIKSGLDFLTVAEREWILRKTAEQIFFN